MGRHVSGACEDVFRVRVGDDEPAAAVGERVRLEPGRREREPAFREQHALGERDPKGPHRGRAPVNTAMTASSARTIPSYSTCASSTTRARRTS